jgi:hypothetical protein
VRLTVRPLPLFTIGLVAAGCGEAGAREQAGEEPRPACRVVVKEVPLSPPVGESSGLAESPRRPGLFWTHNDSGGEPSLYAVDAAGQLVATVEMTGARNRDWEDLAAGPCPGGRCLYAADTGNNGHGSRDVFLYRVAEPAAGVLRSAKAERFEARFPRGTPDTEAMFVLPDSSVYLITKGTQAPVELYRWPTPLRADTKARLQLVRELLPEPEQVGDRVTGAAASPDGRWVVVRTYSTLAFFRTAELLGGGGPAYTTDISMLGQTQGEAVSLANDGAVTLTSEGGTHLLPGALSRLACALP